VATIFGIIVGVLATVVVGQYYYRRSTRKSLTPYLILSSPVFAGIDKEVRQHLHFMFRDEEVSELHHLEFLVANDGERAISNLIEPLRLTLPSNLKVLDASILYRSPESLQVSISTESPGEGNPRIVFRFPLLNKREYFLVKVLIGGRLPAGPLEFTALADDLPRRIKSERLTPIALEERRGSIEWYALASAVPLLGFGFAVGHVVYTLYRSRPELFPYPWGPFHASWATLSALCGITLALILGTMGINLMLAVVGAAMPGAPRFPLPRELRRHAELFRFARTIYLGEAPGEDLTRRPKEKSG